VKTVHPKKLTPQECLEYVLFTMMDSYMLAQSKGFLHKIYREPFMQEYTVLKHKIRQLKNGTRMANNNELYMTYTQLYERLI